VFFGIRFSVDLSRSSNYSISINWRSKQRKLSGPRCSFLSESILMWWLTFVKTLRLKFGEFLSFLECKDFVSMSNLKNETRFLKKKKLNEVYRLPEQEKKWLAYSVWRSSVYRGKVNSNFDMNNFWVVFYIERERG